MARDQGPIFIEPCRHFTVVCHCWYAIGALYSVISSPVCCLFPSSAHVALVLQEWRITIERFGRWIDFDNDYKTMNLSFMDSLHVVEAQRNL